MGENLQTNSCQQDVQALLHGGIKILVTSALSPTLAHAGSTAGELHGLHGAGDSRQCGNGLGQLPGGAGGL